MPTIFISGSREIAVIPDAVRERIDRIVASGFDVVVGDSERGVDLAVIRYLASCSYANVTVFTIHDQPRVKGIPDDWSVNRVEPDVGAKTDAVGNIRNRRELETAKDRAMSDVADYGLVVWQSVYTNRFGNVSVSKGSLRNMYSLLSKGSPVVLYEVPVDQLDEAEFSCHELRTLEELKALVSSEPDVVARFFDALEKEASADAPRLFD